MKAIKIPDLDNQELECVYIPFPTKLIYVLRLFFGQMMTDGVYATTEDAERGKNYFSEIEASMLFCNSTEVITQNQNQNMCTLVSVLIPLLTEGAVSPAIAMGLCEALRSAFREGEGSIEWTDAQSIINQLIESGVGKNTNQLEQYQKKIAELIGGEGVVPDVD